MDNGQAWPWGFKYSNSVQSSTCCINLSSLLHDSKSAWMFDLPLIWEMLKQILLCKHINVIILMTVMSWVLTLDLLVSASTVGWLSQKKHRW